jgi:site-specific recombinase XerD
MRLRPDRARSALGSIDPSRRRAGWPVGLRDGALVALVAAGLSAVEISRLQASAIHMDGGRVAIDLTRDDIELTMRLPQYLGSRLLAWLRESRLWAESTPVLTGPRGPLTPTGIHNVLSRYRTRSRR